MLTYLGHRCQRLTIYLWFIQSWKTIFGPNLKDDSYHIVYMYLALAASSLWGEPVVKCKMFPIGQPLNFWSLSTRVFSAPHSTDGHALGSFHAGIWWLDQTTDQIIVVPCHRSSYIHWAQVTSCSFALIYQILCFLWPWSRWNFVFIPTFVTSYSFFTIASIFIYPYHFVWIAL